MLLDRSTIKINRRHSTHVSAAHSVTATVLLVLVYYIAAVTPSTAQPHAAQLSKAVSVADKLANDPTASLFVNAMRVAGLWDNIVRAKKITVFVPTDQALRTDGSAFLLDSVLLSHENKQRLVSQMGLHFSLDRQSQIIPHQLKPGNWQFNTYAGVLINARYEQLALTIGPGAVVSNVYQANNGIIYFVDRLLWVSYLSDSN